MPNRILRESICTSESLNQVSWFSEVLFYRLIVTVDDFGRFDGRTAVIKSRLFPLKENLTLKVVDEALNELATAELLNFYWYEGKRFVCLPTWERHNSARAKVSKFPAPENGLQASANICKQMQANVSVFGFENRESRIDIRYSDSDSNDSTEPQADSAPPFIELPLNDGSFFPVSKALLDEWSGLYPSVDVEQQLRNMRAWLDANRERRKTRRGIRAFVVRWLSKEHDSGRNTAKKSNSQPIASGNSLELEAVRRMMNDGL